MKNLLIVYLLFAVTFAKSQYFQQRFNLNYAVPQLRNERNNSGIRTTVNYANGNPNFYYFTGIGTSYSNTALGVPPNGSNRLRFIKLNSGGNTVINNLGHQFTDTDGKYFHAFGNSIAEVNNGQGTGGYVAVGAVTNNNISGADNIAGGSDILFVRLNATGAVLTASNIDVNAGGNDTAWCIRKSIITYQGNPTWILCGQSTKGTRTDCVVARVLANGTIVWCYTYNFDPGGAPYNTAFCIAKQLCEAPNGAIYVAGTLRDGGSVNTDGLAFSLDPAGNLLWANNYNAASDDQFQAIRIAANGNLIIGGFTNSAAAASVTHNMLLVQLIPGNGAIVFQRILQALANDSTTKYTSKCYDIVQGMGAGGSFFLAGLVVRNGVTTQMLYRTDAAGIGQSWHHYNAMLYNVGFGIDDVPAGNYPGVAFFSSVKNMENPNFSDAHIMKIKYSGGTCNFCDEKRPALTINGNLQPFKREGLRRDICARRPLNWLTYSYDNILICNSACAQLAVTSADSQSQALKPSVKNSSSLKISPNPVVNTLHIQAAVPAGEYEIQLIDMQGGLIQKRTDILSKGSFSADLNTSSLIPGIYLVTIKGGTLVLQQKVVKQ